MIDFKQLACLNRDELLENVVPFWLTHSQDERYGGYFTCLDRGGDVYDTDKFVWLQGRQVWLFSMLYNQVEKRPEWLECAVQGAEFLRKHGHDGNYNWYFSLTREGRPLVAPYNIFSYTFATMAFAQAALATGSDQYAEIAKRTFARILEKRDNPKGPWCKTVPGTRDLKDFALPMILCNMALEAEQMIDPALLDATIRDCIHQVMEVFYRGELGLIVENVAADGELSDSFEGRQINPGHTLEAMWFIMNLGVRLNDRALIDKAVKIALDTAEYGWDKEYGGLFYFMDRLGHPQQQLEWGPETVVGAYRSDDRDDQGIPPHRFAGVSRLVPPAARLHLVAFQGPRIPRMVRLSEPPRRGAAPAQGRQMERLFPCTSRSVPVLENTRRVPITQT